MINHQIQQSINTRKAINRSRTVSKRLIIFVLLSIAIYYAGLLNFHTTLLNAPKAIETFASQQATQKCLDYNCYTIQEVK